MRPTIWASVIAASLFGFSPRSVSGQIATLDASDTASSVQDGDPTDPKPPAAYFDEDPDVIAPQIPDDILKLYLPSPDGTANALVSAAQSQNAVAVAGLALGLSGLASGTVGYEIDPYTKQQPVVITSDPDTHTLQSGKKAAVYYIPPTEPAEPYRQLDVDSLVFDFGPATSPVAPGAIQVTEASAYGRETGYGWGDTSKVTSGDANFADADLRDYCKVEHGRAGGAIDSAVASPTPFYVDLVDGRYKITVRSAPAAGGMTSRLSVWAQGAPELVLSTNKSTGVSGSFTINVRGGRLMLEFFNALDKVESATDPNTWAYVQGVTIERVPDGTPRKPTIFVASDSTAASYAASAYPLTGWGARLANFLADDVAVENRAVAGASSKSFYEHRWLRNIENRIMPGDFFFIMFAINDSADDLPGYPATKRKTSPASDFKAYLRQYVDVARRNNATPVFITSQTKRTYDAWGRFSNSVGAYPQAMRELGAELNVPVVDLNKMSIDFLDAILVEASANVYMFFPAGKYTGWPNGSADYIHLQDYGATMYARLITQELRRLNIDGLSRYVLDQPR
jgi:lysophospholipase L1-like esterase